MSKAITEADKAQKVLTKTYLEKVGFPVSAGIRTPAQVLTDLVNARKFAAAQELLSFANFILPIGDQTFNEATDEERAETRETLRQMIQDLRDGMPFEWPASVKFKEGVDVPVEIETTGGQTADEELVHGPMKEDREIRVPEHETISRDESRSAAEVVENHVNKESYTMDEIRKMAAEVKPVVKSSTVRALSDMPSEALDTAALAVAQCKSDNAKRLIKAAMKHEREACGNPA